VITSTRRTYENLKFNKGRVHGNLKFYGNFLWKNVQASFGATKTAAEQGEHKT